MRSTTRQGGSVKVFVIVAVILVLIALGVLYGVRRVAMNGEMSPITLPGQSDVENSNDSETGEFNEGETGTTDEDSDTSSTSTDEDATTSTDDESSSEQPAGELPGATDTPEPQTPSQPTQESTDADALPQTGPAETVSVLGAALVATATVAYVRSRKLI